jgi:long-chain acyl-CoA synthetase
MNEENLARQAELALDRQGDYDSLFYEGQWHSSGSLADRAARFATGSRTSASVPVTGWSC